MLEKTKKMLEASLPGLKELALGGTAVGTGLNAPKNFGPEVAKVISELTGKEFVTAENKFHALTAKDDITFAHGALKALAADLMKIANDVRCLQAVQDVVLAKFQFRRSEREALLCQVR